MPHFSVTIHGKPIRGKSGKTTRRKRWYTISDYGLGPDGRRIRKWSKGFETEAEAKAHRDHLLRVRPALATLDRQRLTVAAFVEDHWLPAVLTSYRPSTLASYERNLRQHVLPRLGHVRLADLDPQRLNVLYGELQTAGRRDGTGGLSRRTVRYIHTIVHRVLNDAVAWEFTSTNVASRANPGRASAGSGFEFRTWDAEEVSRFLAASRAHRGRGKQVGDRLYAAWVLLITTGMRRGEVLGLRWSDLDLEGQHLAVRQTLVDVQTDGRHVATFSAPKTDGSRRNIALDAATVAVLRAHKARQAAERLAAAQNWDDLDLDLVFATPLGAPLHPERFSREFARRVEAYGLPRIRLHDLRHSHASLALMQGVHLKVLSDRLGHASVAITGDVYAHVTPSLGAEAAEAVARLFMPAAGE